MAPSRLRLMLAVLTAALAASPALACDTPVFRVAMFDPRWRPHPYQFFLLRETKLTVADQKRLNELNALLDRHEGHLNCGLEVLDQTKQRALELHDMLQGRRPPGWPYLVLRHPLQNRIDGNVWAGAFASAPLHELLQSPARQQIARKLLGGETAVWVLLEAGDKVKDQAAFVALTRELGELQRTLQLPDIGPGGKLISIPNWAPPAKIAFSILRLSRTDAAERCFVNMLLGMEDDLDRFAAEPIVFPVFGRGAVLEPLIGKGITPQNIGKVVHYLTGACTCEEKEQNPVKDLLMLADWETGTELPNISGLLRPPVALATKEREPRRQPSVVPPVAAPAAPPPGTLLPDKCGTPAPADDDSSFLRGALFGMAAGLVVLLGAGAIIVFWKKPL